MFLLDAENQIGSSDEILDGGIGAPDYQFGNQVAIDENFAWDVYMHPKIINLLTGEIADEDKDKDIFSGDQKSSILQGKQPLIAFNQPEGKLAIADRDKIIVKNCEQFLDNVHFTELLANFL